MESVIYAGQPSWCLDAPPRSYYHSWMPNKDNQDKNAGREKNTANRHSVFHEDENLQGEQDEFDAATSSMTPKQAVEAIKRLMAKKEAEEKKGDTDSK